MRTCFELEGIFCGVPGVRIERKHEVSAAARLAARAAARAAGVVAAGAGSAEHHAFFIRYLRIRLIGRNVGRVEACRYEGEFKLVEYAAGIACTVAYDISRPADGNVFGSCRLYAVCVYMYIGLQVSVSGLKAGSYILVGIGPEPVLSLFFHSCPPEASTLPRPSVSTAFMRVKPSSIPTKQFFKPVTLHSLLQALYYLPPARQAAAQYYIFLQPIRSGFALRKAAP